MRVGGKVIQRVELTEADCSLLSILRKLFMRMNNAISVRTKLLVSCLLYRLFFPPLSTLHFSVLPFTYKSVKTGVCTDVWNIIKAF